MLKCVECNTEAEYINKGQSLCSKHYKISSDNGTLQETKYYALLNEYKGSKHALEMFFNKSGEKSNLTYGDKCRFLTYIIEYAERNKIHHDHIAEALYISIKRNRFDIKYIIAIMSSLNKESNSKSKGEDIFRQIAKNT